KVYDKESDSFTDELIHRLNLLRDADQVYISREDIRYQKSILQCADLVKFSKSAHDIELYNMHSITIDMEIDHVNDAHPEPTAEERLLDAKYKEALERKAKRKKIILTAGICVFLLLATLTVFSLRYGFYYVKDTNIGHGSKELLEGEW